MKNILYFLILLLTFSCTDSKQSVKEKMSFQEISEDLGDKYTDIVNDLKTRHSNAFDAKTKGLNSSRPLVRFISEIDQYKLSSLTYFKFDNKKFYEDPSIENLQKCMTPMDKMNIIAERAGVIEWRVVIYKLDGKWAIDKLTQQYGYTISWLCDSLYNAGTSKCKIFLDSSSREFVSYEKDGKSSYFKITGEPIQAERLCELFVAEYKRRIEMDNYIKEHPEIFCEPTRE